MHKEVYAKHRRKLMESVEEDSAVILFSGEAPKKSADASYPFSPNRNFLYVTGIAEEGIILFMERVGDDIMETLFIHPYDELKAKWVGETIRSEEAEAVSGISDIRHLEEFEEFLHKKIHRGRERIWLDLEKDSFAAVPGSGGVFARRLRSEYPQLWISNAYPLITALRVIKDPEEVAEIRQAISHTKDAILNLWAKARPGMKEYELEADFNYSLKKNGVKELAFPTICAAGRQATVLHYEDNDQVAQDGQMVLLDLGASHNHYCADISRTFPVNGRFTDRQKEIYTIVRLAMDRVFAAIKPGVPFQRLNEITRETYAAELKRIGLIADESEVSRYYFHGVSHYLGLDTHDVGSREIDLAPGMVLTVEPGLYIPEEGIGIRVEDDVLVTEDGMENLSIDIPRDIDEIEALIGIR